MHSHPKSSRLARLLCYDDDDSSKRSNTTEVDSNDKTVSNVKESSYAASTTLNDTDIVLWKACGPNEVSCVPILETAKQALKCNIRHIPPLT